MSLLLRSYLPKRDYPFLLLYNKETVNDKNKNDYMQLKCSIFEERSKTRYRKELVRAEIAQFTNLHGIETRRVADLQLN
jgi:hypothetical protein